MPLTKTGGGVALPFQMICDGVLGGIQAFGRGRKEHVLMHANALGIATGEQGCTGWRAYWGGHHKARELPAFSGNTVDIRCADGLGTKTAQVAIALVIGKDDDEVGLGSL